MFPYLPLPKRERIGSVKSTLFSNGNDASYRPRIGFAAAMMAQLETDQTFSTIGFFDIMEEGMF